MYNDCSVYSYIGKYKCIQFNIQFNIFLQIEANVHDSITAFE